MIIRVRAAVNENHCTALGMSSQLRLQRTWSVKGNLTNCVFRNKCSVNQYCVYSWIWGPTGWLVRDSSSVGLCKTHSGMRAKSARERASLAQSLQDEKRERL